jgi:hypothetical protein
MDRLSAREQNTEAGLEQSEASPEQLERVIYAGIFD